ncbi:MULTISPECIES: bifunctional riboflavin kinase/FAD synthetase [unclassified Acidovorax]|uniref:bifunctional riboflavin kinase/FAD synthetase n=1 Tax=unclassified Acidovorax TaxID=2684926 RepID=UPI001C439C75|nr:MULTISPECIES: bifunctional riboflavin kinase/FAD synthetase [unclassified Acidovorax]MBV7427428.1 bifunctional riboflavin kinase/FAD synthetase [Acidovorax sp. sif0732]MBV7449788.1 bifunctional riboflavin kinase/FAD synthetase [Acidovorax sp. sif0715]
MKIFRGFHHPGIARSCALTIGNFDGVHRGHQAMLALLNSEAAHRQVDSCVLTFEPHPRDYFAGTLHKPELAPARVGTLRDKLTELARCGVQQTVVLPFDAALAAQSPEAFIDEVLVQGLGARYVLVGDDFRFGRQRAGDYAMLDAAGQARGFDVARMNSYEVHGLRVSSSAVRQALAQGDMDAAARLLGRPYTISGHVVHGRKLGRELGATAEGAGDGFRTLNLRFAHWKPAASGIFAVLVHGLGREGDAPLQGVANLGVRPSLDPDDVNGGRVLLETHCLQWPAELGAEGAYGKIVRVELLHKLHDELKYDGLAALTAGIAKDCADARAYFASAQAPNHTETRRQTTRDRI